MWPTFLYFEEIYTWIKRKLYFEHYGWARVTNKATNHEPQKISLKLSA